MKKDTATFGDVVLAPIPWADKEIGYKIRPAVVISREHLHIAGQIIVLGISSRSVTRENEYEIVKWREAGLDLPSKIWLARPYALSVQYAKRIGKFPPEELLFIYRKFMSFI